MVWNGFVLYNDGFLIILLYKQSIWISSHSILSSISGQGRPRLSGNGTRNKRVVINKNYTKYP